MIRAVRSRLSHVLPWIVSAAALVYVFGFATDWTALRAAMARADVPLFLGTATLDRLTFFFVWTWLQAIAMRRFAGDVSLRSIFAIRGASELLRVLSNPLADGVFYLGLAQLVKGRVEAVVAAAVVPGICHLLVLLLQASLMIPLLEGGAGAHLDVAVPTVVVWGVVLAGAVGLRWSAERRIPGLGSLRVWLDRFPLRSLLPFFWGFVVMTLFDVLIQGIASRAFGVTIDWLVLAAKIPALYLVMAIPSLGNFGTRELAWANLFEDFGERDTLIAYALATNGWFLILNVVIGVTCLPRALSLLRELRRARQQGATIPKMLIHDPTDT